MQGRVATRLGPFREEALQTEERCMTSRVKVAHDRGKTEKKNNGEWSAVPTRPQRQKR